MAPDASADDIIDSLDGCVSAHISVNDGEVIDILDSINLTSEQLKQILQICNKGFQISLSERMPSDSYQAIIDYIRERLSRCS